MKPMRKCAVLGCREGIAQGKAFCRAHWYALPKPIRDEIWRAYRAKDRKASLRVLATAARYIRSAGA